MRNEVQHFERLALYGRSDEIAKGAKIFLTCDGPERKRGSDTIKVIDRLEIGQHQITFTELAAWLREMAKCAQIIAENREGPKSAEEKTDKS
jgi:hypothetical protein